MVGLDVEDGRLIVRLAEGDILRFRPENVFFSLGPPDEVMKMNLARNQGARFRVEGVWHTALD